ncbi:MAG: succinate dehydrogenase assembly factor 2 [Magnetococcus sp. DMHC-6]
MTESEVDLDPTPLSAVQRRLIFTAQRRSMPEMERILDIFLDRYLLDLDEVTCLEMLELLSFSDMDLLWFPFGTFKKII